MALSVASAADQTRRRTAITKRWTTMATVTMSIRLRARRSLKREDGEARPRHTARLFAV
jgi:hypothetical protein